MFKSLLPVFGMCLGVTWGMTRALAVEALRPDTDPLAGLVEEWRSSSYATRAAATRRLEEAGVSAFPALAMAAQSSDAEVRHRALGLLRAALGQSLPEVQSAARAALEQVQKEPGNPAARLAAQILHNHDHPAPTPRVDPRILAALRQRNMQLGMRNFNPQLPGMPNAAPAGRPNLALPAIPNPALGQRISARWFQGSLFLDVETQTRKISLEETAGGKYRGQLTETINGVKNTQRIEAENLAELEQKHPSVYQTLRVNKTVLDRLRPAK